MKRDFISILVGILFVAAGVAVGGSILGYFDFTINFAGWWTLFIILPALISMTQGGINLGNIIMLGVGAILLMNAQGVLPEEFGWRLFVPFIFIALGVQIIFGKGCGGFSRHHGKHRDGWKGCCGSDGSDGTGSYTDAGESRRGAKANKNESSYKIASVVCGGQEIKYGSEDFTGANYSVVCGGLEIDMRSVRLAGDVIITVSVILGGIELKLPENVRVVNNVSPVLGGVDCAYASAGDANAPKVIINGSITLGGIDIK